MAAGEYTCWKCWNMIPYGIKQCVSPLCGVSQEDECKLLRKDIKGLHQLIEALRVERDAAQVEIERLKESIGNQVRELARLKEIQ